MIGDEVMFVVDSVADAARIGLGLADAYADDDLLSDVRVGPGLRPGACCATATTSGRPSTWPTGSSTSAIPGRC